jgi:hypothetical protein
VNLIRAVLTLGAFPMCLWAQEGGNVEFTPIVGYTTEGSIETDPGGVSGEGELLLKSGLAYGAELGYTPNERTWLEFTFLRQDTRLEFAPDAGAAQVSDLSVNFLHAGARQEFGTGRVRPFVGGSLGATIYKVDRPSVGSRTVFSLAALGGARARLSGDRLGVRGNLRAWFSLVPEGVYGSWCGIYGCFVTGENRTVTQVEASLAVQFTF